MSKKRSTSWEVRVLKASAVFRGLVYAPDEKTARKVAIKQLTINAIDQKRLLFRRRP